MREFFTSLFSRDFVQRSECGAWEAAWANVYQFSNAVIFACYMAIPVFIIIGWIEEGKPRPRKAPSRAHLRCAVAAFVLFCGFGHLFDGVLAMSIAPMYHALALWHALTAAVSVWAAVAVFLTRKYFAKVL